MPVFLSKRKPHCPEWMDRTNCDRNKLFNTYRQFRFVNALVAGWKQLFESKLMPVFTNSDQSYSLLDIGFGGGDIAIKIARWARQKNISLTITAIETDRRALQFIHSRSAPKNLTFLHASPSELLAQRQRFDVVISNNLLHHVLNLPQFLAEARELSTKMVLFNDIERSDVGYMLFNLLSRPLFRSSFITHDGLASIRRSYTKKELQLQIPGGWYVERRFPFRLLLSFYHEQ